MASTDDEPKTALPTNDAWTGMLAISLLALVAGCVLLFLDWRNYMEKPSKMTPLPPITQEKDDGAAKDQKEGDEAPPADAKGKKKKN
jgi:hypothetical protein